MVLAADRDASTLLAGSAAAELAWKVPFTYAVPFCVATWGALTNSRR